MNLVKKTALTIAGIAALYFIRPYVIKSKIQLSKDIHKMIFENEEKKIERIIAIDDINQDGKDELYKITVDKNKSPPEMKHYIGMSNAKSIMGEYNFKEISGLNELIKIMDQYENKKGEQKW